jgi:hypothetical protein
MNVSALAEAMCALLAANVPVQARDCAEMRRSRMGRLASRIVSTAVRAKHSTVNSPAKPWNSIHASLAHPRLLSHPSGVNNGS